MIHAGQVGRQQGGFWPGQSLWLNDGIWVISFLVGKVLVIRVARFDTVWRM